MATINIDVVVAGRHTNELNPQYKGSQKFTIRHCHEICNNYFAKINILPESSPTINQRK